MSWIIDRLNMLKEHSGVPDIENRRSGRTTSNILLTIGTAMNSPEIPVVITDHFHGSTEPKRFAYMFPMLQDILNKLELEGFFFNRSEGTLTFSLDPYFLEKETKSHYLKEIKR